MPRLIRVKGGEGSGYRGHTGSPGRGGSIARGAGSVATESPSTSGLSLEMTTTISEIEKEIVKLKSHEMVYGVDEFGDVLFEIKGVGADAEGKRAGSANIPNDSLKELHDNGGIFTHNHPTGTSFSVDDVMAASQFDLAEMRAIGTTPAGKTYVYRIRAREGAWPRGNALRKAIDAEDASVRKDFTARMRAGSMTIQEANSNHWHEIWERLAEDEDLGIEYIRVEL